MRAAHGGNRDAGVRARLKESRLGAMSGAGMERLKYVSRFSRPLTRADIQRIANLAAAHNETVGLSGTLVASGGVFIQILEGPTDAIDGVFRRIKLDARHRDIVVLRREVVGSRLFGSWAMRLVELDDGATKRMAPTIALVHGAAKATAPAGRALHELDDALWRAVGNRLGAVG